MSATEIRRDSLYPLKEAMKVSGLGPTSFRAGRKSGELRVMYFGRKAYIEGADLIAYIKSNSRATR